jgi:disulfide bond formation protein DsbB
VDRALRLKPAGGGDDGRWPDLLGFAICAALIALAYYLQYGQGLNPCPLCIFQRIAFFVMGVLFLIAGLHAPDRRGRLVYGLLLVITALGGCVLAIRHLYLQSLPAELAPSCGADLSYMLRKFPLRKTLLLVFQGSGDCHAIDWKLLGLTLPGWALVWFVLLGGWAAWTHRPAYGLSARA